MGNKNKAIFLAVAAALLYGLSTPCSKLLLKYVPSTLMAGLLYLGAGMGMLSIYFCRKAAGKSRREEHLSKADTPYVVGMILLDIAAPVFLLKGLETASAAHVALLNNFEIVATALLALTFFREKISGRLWLTILLVTAASVLLSWEGRDVLSLSGGSLLVLLACTCWGLENNCTGKLSEKDPLEIVIFKGFGSGTGAVVTGLLLGERFPSAAPILPALALGFVAYGLSIYLYVYAQRALGAAKTSAYYAMAPFIGSAISLVLFRHRPTVPFLLGAALMAVGAWLGLEKEEKHREKIS